MFKVLKKEGNARRGEFTCPHGTVQTPVFMNVGTQAAIKGALSAEDLDNIGCQIELSNTYHLHVRPGDELIKRQGGLHKFMTWEGPILTDSGGFQIFSLASLRKITEEGVAFNSHVDGRHIFMGPEESMRIQSNSHLRENMFRNLQNAHTAGLYGARRLWINIIRKAMLSIQVKCCLGSIRALFLRTSVLNT